MGKKAGLVTVYAEWMGDVKCIGGASRISQNFCKSEQEWSSLLKKTAGLVKHSAEAGRIGHIFCRSEQGWPNFLPEWTGLVACLQEWVGLNRSPA